MFRDGDGERARSLVRAFREAGTRVRLLPVGFVVDLREPEWSGFEDAFVGPCEWDVNVIVTEVFSDVGDYQVSGAVNVLLSDDLRARLPDAYRVWSRRVSDDDVARDALGVLR